MASVYKTLSKTSTSNPPSDITNGLKPKNKQRVLILSSRGVTYRHRHFLNDIYSLLPHSRKDAKLDTKTKLYQLNELAELYNCNNVLFFEARKGKDLYLWMSKAPNGPTVKMHAQNRTPITQSSQSFGDAYGAAADVMLSTYNVRTPFPGELPERLQAYPVL